MADDLLKSYAFRREREPAWRALETLVGRVEKKGLGALDATQLQRLPSLYRAALSALSVARNISLDRALQVYLESLCSRAFLCVYGPQRGFTDFVVGFFRRDWPRAMRAAAVAIWIAALVMALGALLGYVLTFANLDWYYALMPDGLMQGREPTSTVQELRASLFNDQSDSDSLTLFASYLFAHNTRVGILCFVLGFALGLPTVVILFQNGLTLGAFAALYANRGLGPELWGWLLIHGTTELTAVVLCGGAGLLLGHAILFPGRYRRMTMLMTAGRRATLIVIGAAVMFLIAGLLEGIGRQTIDSTATRLAIGGAMLLFWLTYFTTAGRSGRDERNGDG